MRLHYLQHVPFEDLASIELWARDKGYEISCTRFFEDESLPSHDSYDWLVIMGGPMNIDEHEKYPWFVSEKQFIREAIEKNKYILGVCLGAQLIASALGAKVLKNSHKEIGWFPVKKTEEGKGSELLRDVSDVFMAFHWHGDTFEIPPGCVHLLESAACKNQAFQKGDRIFAMQFHLDTQMAGVFKLLEHCSEEVVPGPFIQNSEVMTETVAYFDSIQETLSNILERLLQSSAKKS